MHPPHYHLSTMCTVSYYANETQIMLTSNRDEHYSRTNALPPQVYKAGNNQLIYSKDVQAGGTWIAVRNDGTAIVLLNGAFERHTHQPPYKKSRGLVLLDIINEEKCLQKFNNYDLANIEPFTIILYIHHHLYQCIWDGSEKYLDEKSPKTAHIWSSVTLYDKEFREKKQQLFKQFLQTKKQLSEEDILKFHHSKYDIENGLLINRKDQLYTFSVTQITLNNTKNSFYHHDLKDDKEYIHTMHANLEKSLL